VAWSGRPPAAASWPQVPAGWRIVSEDSADGWVAWRR